MIFYFCAAMTFISAAVSFGFSIDAYRSATTETLSNAMYAVSRSLALLIATTVPFFYHVDAYLCAVAMAMILVQLFDGIIGIRIKNTLKTVGPFCTAFANVVCLIILYM
ncbi:hypothetical protein HCJ66_00270 [Listeria sp. FSL L7-1582]|nr:hypothetical protein [Listeria portnoyi]